jgi:IS5 family transposase
LGDVYATMKIKLTRREKFLSEMERIVPWSRLIAVIEPLYPKSGRVGRQPIGISKMLRMYRFQQWYDLAGEALCDSQAMRDFNLSHESVPDATSR